MLPIILDGSQTRIALVGTGELLAKRLAWLRAGGASSLTVFAPGEPVPEEGVAGVTWVDRLPLAAELALAHAVWLTGLEAAVADELASVARRVVTLVNVEDALDKCDFHTPAVVRRGDLLLTVSTGGKSPGLAASVRQWLERQFGPEWAQRVDALAGKRNAWRRRPRGLEELAFLTEATIARKGWLGPRPAELERAA